MRLRIASITGSLLLLLACRPGFAQGTNTLPASTVPVTMSAPDPSGAKTGTAADAQSIAGSMFVVSAPAALSAQDKLDPKKLAHFLVEQKAFDDFTAQA